MAWTVEGTADVVAKAAGASTAEVHAVRVQAAVVAVGAPAGHPMDKQVARVVVAVVAALKVAPTVAAAVEPVVVRTMRCLHQIRANDLTHFHRHGIR